MKRTRQEIRPLYTAPALVLYGSVAEITMMPGGSVGCEGASGKLQRVDTGEDVGGECNTPPGQQ